MNVWSAGSFDTAGLFEPDAWRPFLVESASPYHYPGLARIWYAANPREALEAARRHYPDELVGTCREAAFAGMLTSETWVGHADAEDAT